MEQVIMGYVRLEEGYAIYPYIDKEENGYLIQIGKVTEWVDKRRCREVEETEEEDKINPPHYKNGIETIDYMQAVMCKKQFEGYLRGNVIKYISRYDKKNGVEDLKKAEWYQDRLTKHLEDKI